MSRKVKPYEQKITVVQKFVSEEVFNELVKENESLKTRLHELNQENDNLRSNNIKLELTINELRKENELLKAKIVELESKVNKLDIDNKELKDDNKDLHKRVAILECENKELRAENKNLTERLNIKDKKEAINKLLEALQDVNRSEQLEKKCPPQILNSLIRVKKSRNKAHHFINEQEDSPFDKSCAYVALLIELRKLKDDVKIEIEDKYPYVIQFYQDALSQIVDPKKYSDEDLAPFIQHFEV